ncbi:hypothetical protein HPP92_021242 [Vanilla planifolia]|uniref:Uncharacterized protein n=1 Tax=Vanilla planifolia TaxID=51239 RepID=A0A835UHD1_VANPL|nr:hypothetical protein HPP92_021242 [Vanilla planifolia]
MGLMLIFVKKKLVFHAKKAIIIRALPRLVRVGEPGGTRRGSGSSVEPRSGQAAARADGRRSSGGGWRGSAAPVAGRRRWSVQPGVGRHGLRVLAGWCGLVCRQLVRVGEPGRDGRWSGSSVEPGSSWAAAPAADGAQAAGPWAAEGAGGRKVFFCLFWLTESV